MDMILLVSIILGFYAAWNIGANDVANAMGTSVGSKALTLKRAVILAALFEFSGAVLFGSNVSETLSKNLVNASFFQGHEDILIRGMLASLLATGVWLQVATHFGLPVSTTHTIVGAIVGFGIVLGGFHVVYWENVIKICCSWVFSPILGAFAAFLLFTFLRKKIFHSVRPLDDLKKLLPWLVAAVTCTLYIGVVSQVLHTTFGSFALISSTLIIALISAYYTRRLTRKLHHKKVKGVSQYDQSIFFDIEGAKKHLYDLQKKLSGPPCLCAQEATATVEVLELSLREGVDHQGELKLVERIFSYLQISSACLMAFAHGSNDVANAIGPMSAIITLLSQYNPQLTIVPAWGLVLGGIGIVVGLATWGWKVIETIGKRITELTPSRGFAAEFGAAMTILAASAFGFPVSTTHIIVGAVFGVGFAGGFGSLNLLTLRDIVVSWFVTIPAGAILSIGCYYLLTWFL